MLFNLFFSFQSLAAFLAFYKMFFGCLFYLTNIFFVSLRSIFKELACLFKTTCFPRRSSLLDTTDAIRQNYTRRNSLVRENEWVNQYRNVDRCYCFHFRNASYCIQILTSLFINKFLTKVPQWLNGFFLYRVK